MLRIIQNSSSAGAKSYYSTADYYTEGQELVGQWRGRGAAALGFEGVIQAAQWDALCDNLHPETNQPLTLRRNETRRVGYDFNFHVPKSVSLLYGLTRDERLLDAFRDSVNATMEDMEAELQTRVRKGDQNVDRLTGNMIWGEFIHFTARPINGVPDPHLHAHCFVFNATWDAAEKAWKAGQFAGLKRDAPYFEAVFHSRLASRLGELGLAVERKKWGWELAGLDAATLEKFSRRTAQIEEEARKLGIDSPEAKAELGAKTRERKQKDLPFPALQREWDHRLTEQERLAFEALARHVGSQPYKEEADAAQGALERAVEHVFERKSVVPKRELLTQALKRSVGDSNLAQVHAAYDAAPLIRAKRDGRQLVTTPLVMAEERAMIAFARNGRGTELRLGPAEHHFTRDWLNADQRRAVAHVLRSTDRVILVRGAAGVGKTTMFQEAVEAIEQHGQTVFALAPSAAAKTVLQDEGFERAETVARFLVDPELQQAAAGHVVWIDEAGLLGTKALGQVFQFAEKHQFRVILSGDRKQHGSVERGAALRLLEIEAGLVPAEIREIQRQRGHYKLAVRALAAGDTERGFEELDRLGWIKEMAPDERDQQMAADYVASVTKGLETLVVSPTHREGERITSQIRGQLQAAGRVGTETRQFEALVNLKLTEAERAEPEQYQPGQVIVFHQNATGFRKGERLAVGASPVPLDKAARFQVFQPKGIELAKGDRLRVTRNGKTLDGLHRLNNGAIYEIREFDDAGNIVLANGWTIAKDYGHLTHGYCVTSHASQGRTVDRVLIGQAAESFSASSREQFYVSVSRARKSAVVFTEDKQGLLAAIQKSDPRLSATELAAGLPPFERGIMIKQLQPEWQPILPDQLLQREREAIYDR